MILLLYYICMFVASMCTGDKNSLLNAVGAAQGRKGTDASDSGSGGATGLCQCH